MYVRMELVYRTPKGTDTGFSSEDMPAKKALLIAEDLEKTGRVKTITFIDRHENTWNLKELRKQLEEIEAEPHNIMVYFDGGFNLETGKAGLGCAIYYEQNGKVYRLRKNAAVDELETNNEAEYAALHLGVKELEHLGAHHITIEFAGDSQVVINQLAGEWPCYEEALSNWADRIENKFAELGLDATFEVVSRKKNKEADQLASQALSGIEIFSKREIKNGEGF
ncbi:ribonuclease H family protein [Virgibacillus alimentarius]|uniref:ribonuclease H family protein n=1 Tax=Virgibacillus alimentarius TaxID=698769 RepID=UPI0004930D8B|nr:ribonuclease H family protein [Virgibacillus alimentarius]